MSVLLYPPYLQWEITPDCNHRCIHCYNYWRTGKTSAEKCPDFDRITDQIIARKPVYLSVTGGEPLLEWQKIKPCLSRIVAAGITVTIMTNGTLITDEMAEFLAEKDISLVISMPSANEEVCDRITMSSGVVKRLRGIFEILRRHGVATTINIVLTKLNLATLAETLAFVKKCGFMVRIALAQRPINASDEYKQYELDRKDFANVVQLACNVQKQLGLYIDFAVCVPDCAFNNERDFLEVDRGSCYAGRLAYAIAPNGDVKACQCDIKIYGNILVDRFEDIYDNMSEWRDGSLIPEECAGCNRMQQCRGGCHVESYACKGNRKAFPVFGDLKNVPVRWQQTARSIDYSDETRFAVSEGVNFVDELNCCRISIGRVPVYITNEFAAFLKKRNRFTFKELESECDDIERPAINTVLNMLVINGILIVGA